MLRQRSFYAACRLSSGDATCIECAEAKASVKALEKSCKDATCIECAEAKLEATV